MEGNMKPQKPDNFLVWAILSTVMCCVPLGIVAVIFSNKVDTLWYSGNYEEAEEALRKAKMWTYISAGAGAFMALCVIAFYAIMFIVAINN